LERVAEDEEQEVNRLPLLGEEERRQLVEEWNETRAEYPEGKRIHELFEEQVEKSLDAIALTCEDEQLSYAELNARANRLAHHLREMGVGSDVLVAICLERGAEMVVAMLAALKAGGAYLPLDPAYPPERLAYMLEDSSPAVLLTRSASKAALAAHTPWMP